MSTRRRVGFNTSASEASRRQLMQPVPCWEKVWSVPDGAAPGSTLRVYKWVKTDKKQQFSDDESETDQPLAPLPLDDVEVVEGDEELDQDEATASQAPDTASRDVSETPLATPLTPANNEEESKPPTPKPHPLSISFTPAPDNEAELEDALDASLKPVGDMAGGLEGMAGLAEGIVAGVEGLEGMEGMEGMEGLGEGIELNLEGVGPDGEPFEGAGTIEQLQAGDALLGGGLMAEAMEQDPFVMEPPPEN